MSLYPATNGHWHLYLIAADAGIPLGWATTPDPYRITHPQRGLELRLLHTDGGSFQVGRPYWLRAGPNEPGYTYTERQLTKKLAKIKTLKGEE